MRAAAILLAACVLAGAWQGPTQHAEAVTTRRLVPTTPTPTDVADGAADVVPIAAVVTTPPAEPIDGTDTSITSVDGDATATDPATDTAPDPTTDTASDTDADTTPPTTTPPPKPVRTTPTPTSARTTPTPKQYKSKEAPTPMPTSSESDSDSVQTASGLHPLVIKGYRFFDSVTGAYVGLRGINYYPRPNAGVLDANNLDLFTDTHSAIWQRDIPHFVALHANAIRLYAVDPDQDHSAFMCALQAAGIYVIVDLASSCPGCELTPDAAPDCYPASLKTRGEKIIASFAQYDNVLGFSAGNEINHRVRGNVPHANAPCQKKFVRDMRHYIQSCPKMRQIPVGLAVADTNRLDNAAYYTCQTQANDTLETVEWYGLNTYVHCVNVASRDKAAGFENLRADLAALHLSVPLVLTEFGCLSTAFPTIKGYAAQRTFGDAKWMNDKRDSEYFSGGFVFEYSTENSNSKATSAFPFKAFGPQNYGLGYLTPQNCDDVAIPCKYQRFPNFDSLAKAYNATSNDGQPTLKSFEVPADRAKPSKCPRGWPGLAEFQWVPDNTNSLACPTTERFQCPNMPIHRDAVLDDGGDAAASSSSSSRNGSRHEPRVRQSMAPSPSLAVTFGMLAVSIILLLA